MSRIRWVTWLAKALTEPILDAGTSAALATMLPSPAFSVETVGWPPPPHKLRNPSPAGGTTVALSENAPAYAGMLHAEAVTTNSRDAEAANCGPPNGPAASRVST